MKIVKHSELVEQGITHNPDIKKKVIISRGEVPHLMTFGEATFLSGQSVESHTHETMSEIFYLISGRAIFKVNGVSVEVCTGDCITIEAGEVHSQENPFSECVTWLYFGISSD